MINIAMDTTKLARALLAAALFGFLAAHASSGCTLQADKPFVNVHGLKEFTDPNQQVRVAFGGYFKYAKLAGDSSKDDKFVPVQLESVTTELSKLHRSVHLAADCAKITMSIINDRWGTMVTGIQVDLSIPTSDGNTKCELDFYEIKMWSPVGDHYYCGKTRIIGCHSGGKKGPVVGHLAIDYIEFETDGDTKSPGQREFSTERHTCE